MVTAVASTTQSNNETVSSITDEVKNIAMKDVTTDNSEQQEEVDTAEGREEVEAKHYATASDSDEDEYHGETFDEYGYAIEKKEEEQQQSQMVAPAAPAAIVKPASHEEEKEEEEEVVVFEEAAAVEEEEEEEEEDDKWIEEMEQKGNHVFNKSRLIAYFTKHNPKKVDSVDDTLNKYKGMEDVLFERVEKKYGEKFTTPWLTDFYTQYAPDRVDKVDTTVEKFSGKEYDLYRKLEAKYGPFGEEFNDHEGDDDDDDSDGAPASTTLTFHQKRLIAFFKKHNPSKISSVDATLEKYAGRDDELMEKLEAKYQENPTAPLVTEFYIQYDPLKVGDKTDRALEKYKGNEEELFRKLEEKYGTFDIDIDVPTSMATQVKTPESKTYGPWSFGTTKDALTLRKRIAKGDNNRLFLNEPSIKPLYKSERLAGKGALFGKVSSHEKKNILVGDSLGQNWKRIGNNSSKGKPIAPKWSEAGNPSVRSKLPQIVIDGTKETGMKKNTGKYYLTVQYNNDGIGLDVDAGIIIGEICFANNGQALALGAPLDKIEKETYDGKSWNTWVSTKISSLPWMDGNILRFKIDTNTNSLSFLDELGNKHVYPGVFKYSNSDNDVVKIFAYVGAKPTGIANAAGAEVNTLTILKDDDKKW